MHLILSAFGSYGDVLPMVGLGAAVRARGHRVSVIVNPYFQSVVEGAGLEMLPLGTADEYRELMQHPDLWHPQRGLTLVLTRGAAHYLDEVYALLESQVTPGETVLAAHGLDMASRIYHERHDVPLATVHFAPMALTTVHETSRYMGVPNMATWPRWAKRGVFWAADKWKIDPLIAPAVNKLRARHGLPAVARIFTQYNNSPQLVLGLFPDWFGPMQPDWPAHTALVGFPLWDPPAEQQLSAEVDAFLNAGEPPIVFAPGSANVQATDFFQTAADVCVQLGRRGVLMTKYPDQLPLQLPANVRHFGFVPFSQLLPRAAALVHHGGIGTCAQGLACALPQVVMPMAYDQLDNGTRLSRLGVGAIVPEEKFKATRVAATLGALLGSDEVRERCRDYAGRCDGAASLDAASDLLERLHARRGDRMR
ncbi:MAG: glycosyltransferase [Planctomycetaceae bacterium]|nr:glycosyltransferase [Planctomycetaceae bacterium]